MQCCLSNSRPEPSEIIAGDTVAFTRLGESHKASDGWALSYLLNGNGQKYSFAASASGDNFAVTIPASESESWQPGRYEFSAIAKKAGDRIVVARGLLTILENPEKPFISHAARMVANLKANLEGRALPFADIESSNINGQQIIRMPIKQCRELLTYYEARVIAENRARAGCRGATVVKQYF